MSSIDEIRQVRIDKLNKLKGEGVDPYPISVNYDFTLGEVLDSFSELSKKAKAIKIVGRIVSLRKQGALAFFHIYDGTASFQALLKKEDSKNFELFADTIDIGDFVELKGKLFITKRKEKTLAVFDWKIITKTLRPLPEKWHGLQDVEERFRKRYLDILMSSEVRDRFIIRSKIISGIRAFLDDNDFMEVETPALQPVYGGASAKPFITHHNMLDTDLYLRISPELYLKRLITGGFPKVYEIGKSFRNEGIDTTHNPEFTMLEYYESYSDAGKQAKLTEKMLKTLVKVVLKKSKIVYQGKTIDFSKKFTTISYFDLIKRYTLIPDIEEANLSEMKLHAKQLGVKVGKGDTVVKIMDSIYKKSCRPKLIQPTIITDYPVDYLPLAKRSIDNEKTVSAFQIIIAGVELVKAFSELNDPIDQRRRLEREEENMGAGDDEAQRVDEDFIEALEHGMPPAGGVGIGIDRLVMLLTDTLSIKEVILFPTLKPKN
ncbi:lysine--tRNA ligase [Patescibacteria group bacterium]